MSKNQMVARIGLAAWLGLAALPLTADSAMAQDYDPAMSAHESMSQQQFNTQQTAIGNHMVQQSVRRNSRRVGRRGPTTRQAAMCRNKSSFRARYGAGNPDVRKLYRLCASDGM